jgi:hypothetical protein
VRVRLLLCECLSHKLVICRGGPPPCGAKEHEPVDSDARRKRMQKRRCIEETKSPLNTHRRRSAVSECVAGWIAPVAPTVRNTAGAAPAPALLQMGGCQSIWRGANIPSGNAHAVARRVCESQVQLPEPPHYFVSSASPGSADGLAVLPAARGICVGPGRWCSASAQLRRIVRMSIHAIRSECRVAGVPLCLLSKS